VTKSRMMEKRFSIHEGDGERIYIDDDDFHWDALLRVSGDFESCEEKKRYAQAICDVLNAAEDSIPYRPAAETCAGPTAEEMNQFDQYIATVSERRIEEATQETSAAPPEPSVLDRLVTVCGACETAACWQGSFMCDSAEMAGIKNLTVRDLHAKPRGENAEYWFKDGDGKIDRTMLEIYQRMTSQNRGAEHG
jgi:hypothetical protein